MKNQKKWYYSKTLWTNICSAAVVLTQELTGQNFVDPKTALLILAVLNTVLRTITTKSVSL
jgi:hypothetical protein